MAAAVLACWAMLRPAPLTEAPALDPEAALRQQPPGAGIRSGAPGPWELAEQASAARLRVEQGLNEASPLLDGPAAEALDARWCGQGHWQFERELQPIDPAAASSSPTSDAPHGSDAEPGWGRRITALRTAIALRWAEQLRLRPEPLAQALAELLVVRSDAPVAQRERAAQALLQLSLSAADPAALAVALQLPCLGPAGCQQLDGGRWASIEPGNLHAWLWRVRSVNGRWAGDDWRAQLAGLAQARYVRSYAQHSLIQLLQLPQTPQPGLRQQIELELMQALFFTWTSPSYAPLMNACQGRSEAAVRAACEQAAEQLWASDNMLEQGMALGLVRRMAGLERARPWPARAEQLEAMRQWSGEVSALQAEASQSCTQQPAARAQLHALAQRGEAGVLHEQMRERGIDQAAWAARFRQQQRRGLLDPPV
ncbi:hypothetical protein RQP53_03920 [Paucibacter sp. APW11]|uniref:Uncharacterized protein n=1 Tax=Roseateles aquae TaxID=3077235 RepID=A0ABU3P779_9BURK|nr:hypothetical protein [Paucibacter sp. APW11]MDT8998419.1 hypothetical protein [Paucibacter sp. APW11]